MRATLVLLLLSWTCDASAQVFTPTRAPLPAAAVERRRVIDLALIQAEGDLQAAKTAEAVAESRAPARSAREADRALARTRISELEANVAALRKQREAESQGDGGRRGSFLTQAALDGIVNEGSPEVSIQAADLFFNDTFRVYLRSTLSTDVGSEEAETTEETAGDDDAVAAVEERLKSALLDPYGGLLYLATGGFHQVLGQTLPGQKPRGLFLDARGGVKAVQIEESQAESNSVVPFAAISAGLHFQWPVWDDPTQTTDDASVGDVVVGLTWVSNAVLDKSASDLFTGDDPALDRWTHTLAFTAGISLNGVAKLTFTGNPWSSTSLLGKRYTVGLAIVRPN